jgi:RNA recognition motif-containing protein
LDSLWKRLKSDSIQAQVKSGITVPSKQEIGMNIYVGNLSWEVTQEDLLEAFKAHGQVDSANVITDKYTGKSRGFGFVEMPVDEEARAAMNALNGMDLKGRTINVNEARPRNEGSRSGSRGSAGYKSW